MPPSSLGDELPKDLGRLRMSDMMFRPYEVLAEFREASPAVPIESNGYRIWVITRYDDVRKVLADPTVLRDLVEHRKEVNSRCLVGSDSRARIPHGSRRSFFDRDGENHHRLRALMGDVFTPANLATLAGEVEHVTDDLLSKIQVGNPVDLMADYARPVAGKILCKLSGIPADERNMLATLQSEMLTSPIVEEIEKSARELVEWAVNLVNVKRREPVGDLCTDLLKLHEEMKMTEDELTSTYILLVVGGMEPANAIGSGILTFLTHPEQLGRALADPNLFSSCVDEIVRHESPLRFVAPRLTTVPLELGEVTVPAGELLLISLAGGNRDPQRFGSPDAFDITRVTTGHLGFGHGVHRCLGSQLGKIETATSLRKFFERFPATKLVDPPGKADWRPGKFLRRLNTLSVIPG